MIGIQNAQGEDVGIASHWGGSPMAHAAIDPIFRARLSVELLRYPDQQEEIQQLCSRCHTPMADREAKALGIKIKLLGKGGFLHKITSTRDIQIYEAVMGDEKGRPTQD